MAACLVSSLENNSKRRVETSFLSLSPSRCDCLDLVFHRSCGFPSVCSQTDPRPGDKGPDGGTGARWENVRSPRAGWHCAPWCPPRPRRRRRPQLAGTSLSHLLALHSGPFQLQGLRALSGLVGRMAVGSLLWLIIVLRVSSVLGAERHRGAPRYLGEASEQEQLLSPHVPQSFPWKRGGLGTLLLS